ncbi:hypothetical protein BH23BAC1_BH23BAC1_04180 [soil metagenome]
MHNIQVIENNFIINNPDFISSFHSIMDRPYKLTTQNFRTGFEWDLSNKTKIGTIVSANQRHHQMNASSVFDNKITSDSSSYGTIHIDELNVWNHYTSNIHFTHNFSNKINLRLDLDYNWSENNNPSTYQLDFNFPELNLSTIEMIDMTKVTPLNMKVAGLDYTLQPSPKLKFETGVKGTSQILKMKWKLFLPGKVLLPEMMIYQYWLFWKRILWPDMCQQNGLSMKAARSTEGLDMKIRVHI